MRILGGITHSIVSVRKEEDASSTNVVADIELYFGDHTSIAGIRYVRNGRSLEWYGPVIAVYKNGELVNIPVFTGELLIEICKLASRSIARIKQQYGHPEWGAKYKILRDRVDLIQ